MLSPGQIFIIDVATLDNNLVSQMVLQHYTVTIPFYPENEL